MHFSRRLTLLLGAGFVTFAIVAGIGTAQVFWSRAPVAALDGSAGEPVAELANNASLAEAVARWNEEHPVNGPGDPVLTKSADLLSQVGGARDTLSAFPTARGAVCYQILAAGSCGSVDTPSGITFSILTTRDGGARLFGVSSDRVTKVEVVIDGVAKPAILRNNGFYFQLPTGVGGSSVQRVVSTLSDGSREVVSVHE
jgi:hypothetical protein